jgi:hypothetical protein
LPGVAQAVPNNIEGFGLVNAFAAITAALPTANAGSNQTVNGTSAAGASVILTGSGFDPDHCPLTLNWSWGFGAATGATTTATFPLGVSQAALKAINGGTIEVPVSTVQITVTDFTLAGPQSSVSVVPGQAETYTISIGSRFGAFTNPVTLACSGLPALASCSFSPATVTPGSGTTTSTLTITTTAASGVHVEPRWPGVNPLFFWAGLILMLLTMAILAKRSGRKLAATFTFGALALCLGSPLIACSSGGNTPAANSFTGGGTSSPGTPAGTYTITVTGSSNQLQHSTTVTLDVS